MKAHEFESGRDPAGIKEVYSYKMFPPSPGGTGKRREETLSD